MASEPNRSGFHRIRKGEKAFVSLWTLRNPTKAAASVRISYDDGQDDEKAIPLEAMSNTDGTVNGLETDPFDQDGWITDAYVYCDVIKRGQAYATISAGGATHPVRIAAGYVYSSRNLEMGVFQVPGEGPGFSETIDETDPAGNADYPAYTVPAHKRIKVRGFLGVLVTDGNAATRWFHITINDGTQNVGDIVALTTQIASLTRNYRGVVDLQVAAVVGVSYILVALPDRAFNAGYVLTPSTDSKQATDAWGQGYLELESWVIP